ncbi:hypothetical protein EWB00_000858 [Schistosoma japonicum]|uniref:Uncharacterized protein n=1 Tax=Schistosoma japonicum TaxID=6182 RepID=A0A4Z2CK90_SCHJA|nr:hypothetical protein EWB00_000858 [Schistosoma japonicum]
MREASSPDTPNTKRVIVACLRASRLVTEEPGVIGQERKENREGQAAFLPSVKQESILGARSSQTSRGWRGDSLGREARMAQGGTTQASGWSQAICIPFLALWFLLLLSGFSNFYKEKTTLP